MTGDDIARFFYLAILGAVIGGYFLLANRHQMGRMAQQAAIWALIFVGVAAAAVLWQDVRSTASNITRFSEDGGRAVINRAADGHFHLTLGLNGHPVEFMVDTGASRMVLSIADADRIGIDHTELAFSNRAQTANGIVRTAPIRIDEVRFGQAVDRDVPAEVSGGAMPGSLLGMSYLSRFATIRIDGDRMTLVR